MKFFYQRWEKGEMRWDERRVRWGEMRDERRKISFELHPNWGKHIRVRVQLKWNFSKSKMREGWDEVRWEKGEMRWDEVRERKFHLSCTLTRMFFPETALLSAGPINIQVKNMLHQENTFGLGQLKWNFSKSKIFHSNIYWPLGPAESGAVSGKHVFFSIRVRVRVIDRCPDE